MSQNRSVLLAMLFPQQSRHLDELGGFPFMASFMSTPDWGYNATKPTVGSAIAHHVETYVN